MRSLAKLRALSPRERRLLAACLVATPPVALGLRLIGFRRMRSVMAAWPHTDRTASPWAGEEALERSRAVARMAGIAAGRGPVRATCLRRSLLVWWLLRRDGIETSLRIGVRREGGALRAHAWVEYDGVPLGEDDDHVTRYASFDRDFGLATSGRR